MHQPDPVLPPLITGHPVKAPETAHASACRRAALGEIGAADYVWSRNAAHVECALVLEPDVSLARACQMSALGFVAVAETLGHVGPPQMPIAFRWPDTLLVNEAICGHVRLTAPPTAPDKVPPWLVLSFDLALIFDDRKGEPGHRLAYTALDLEGAGDVTRSAVVETLARCLLAWLHSWADSGFRQIADHWRYAAEGRDHDITIDGSTGRVLGLDEDGGLMLRASDGKVEILPYLPHVESWPSEPSA
jgi:BirA family transcriptional regulator, biotin operon repressor / biotin---[acetyl-CoA-carboxylase] ligase